jgi:hypothetical protein
MHLGYWTVPAPGALFVTGSRFWTIVRLSQDRAGKVLALSGYVSWLAGADSRRSPRDHFQSLMIKLPAEAGSGFLRLSKNQPLTMPRNNFLIVLALRSSLAGRRHNQSIMSSGMRGRAGMILAFRLRRVARCRQRKVLKSFVLPGPGRRRRFSKYHDRPHFG